MKANELRIGNYVNFPEHYPNINDVTQLDEYIMFHESFNPEKCRPIPLTEEWLVKFGAIDRNKEERDRFNFKEINWYFGFTEPYGDFRIYQHPDSLKYWLDQYHTIEIKYVHQLQNLYFALTGEELEK